MAAGQRTAVLALSLQVVQQGGGRFTLEALLVGELLRQLRGAALVQRGLGFIQRGQQIARKVPVPVERFGTPKGGASTLLGAGFTSTSSCVMR